MVLEQILVSGGHRAPVPTAEDVVGVSCILAHPVQFLWVCPLHQEQLLFIHPMLPSPDN